MARSAGARRHRATQQTVRRKARDDRDHGQGPPRARHDEDAGRLAGRAGERRDQARDSPDAVTNVYARIADARRRAVYLVSMAGGSVIAVVDDDASVRTALASLLRSAGFVVLLFASGEEFLLSN